MRFLRSILVFGLALIAGISSAQTRFKTAVDGWQANNVIEEKDGSYLVIGNGTQNEKDRDSGNYCISISRLNPKGGLIKNWHFYIDTLPGIRYYSTSCQAHCLVKWNIHYLLAVNVLKASGDKDCIIIQMDSSFKKIEKWNYFKYGLSECYVHFIMPVASNRIMVYLDVRDQVTTYYSCILSELDSNFNHRWSHLFSYQNSSCFPSQLMQTPDTGYILVFQKFYFFRYPAFSEIDGFAIKTDSSGNELWELCFNDPRYTNEELRISPLPDGNYLASWADNHIRGNTNPPNYITQVNDTSSIWIGKFTKDGRELWRKSLRNYFMHSKYSDTIFFAYIYDVVSFSDGSIVLTGTLFLDKTTNVFFLKIDKDGNPVWQRRYDHFPGNHDLTWSQNWSMKKTHDKGFVIAGQYQSYPDSVFPIGIQTGVVTKLDENGCMEAGCELKDGIEEKPKEINFGIYPNPASDQLTICLPEDKPTGTILRIINAMGQIVQEHKIQERFTLVSTSTLRPGLYILTMTEPKSNYNGACNLIIQK